MPGKLSRKAMHTIPISRSRTGGWMGRHLTFSTPSPTIYPKNNTVHAWHFPANSNGRVVLVLPQWNADAQSHISLCRMLNYFGLSALRLSLPYHDLRMPDDLARADYMLSPNLGRTLQSVRQAVVDSRAALDWLGSQGYTKFAILGTSIGSCVALITLAHDSRLELGVMNHVSPYFADVVWKGISTRHVRMGLEGNIDLDDLRKIWMPISPKAYFKKLVGTGKKSLLVHALYDYSFPPDLSGGSSARLPGASPASLHLRIALRTLYFRGVSVQYRSWLCHVQIYPQKPVKKTPRMFVGESQGA